MTKLEEVARALMKEDIRYADEVAKQFGGVAAHPSWGTHSEMYLRRARAAAEALQKIIGKQGVRLEERFHPEYQRGTQDGMVAVSTMIDAILEEK